MSILKKNVLAVALVAGLGLAGSAGAFNLFTSGDTIPVFVATFDIADNTTLIGIDQTFQIDLVGADFILGRTTGFTVRYDLTNGATFGDIIDNTDISVGIANGSWTRNVLAGGTVGSNFLVIKLDPDVTPIGLVPGALLSINAANVVVAPTTGTGQMLNGLAALQTPGVVKANVVFVDPGTSLAIMAPDDVVILQSGDPVVQACDDTDGDNAKTIDVGTDNDHLPKTFFSDDGLIGSLNSAYINLGSITASVDSDFSGSFGYTGADEFTTVVTGDFSAFSVSGNNQVFLSNGSGCTGPGVPGTVNIGAGTVTFNYTGNDISIGPGGYTAYVCAEVAFGNSTVIDASLVSELTTFTRGGTSSTGASCDLLPLRYNGSVVNVYAINPAFNLTAQSFLRIINPSNSAGKVTIDGTDDAGNPSTPISFVLGAGESKQVNSDSLENGGPGLTGAWGNGTGKWRAVVTGEFAGMRVQSLNRNYTDGTVTNLTDADGMGEQISNLLFENGF